MVFMVTGQIITTDNVLLKIMARFCNVKEEEDQ